MHISHRLPENLECHHLAKTHQELKVLGADLVDLTVSNPTRCGFSYPMEDLRAALSRPEGLEYTPDPLGSAQARAALSHFHGGRFERDHCLLTASTSEAYSLLFKLLGDPGDEILVPTPSYPLFYWLARLEMLQTLPVAAYYFDGWHLDVGALESAIGSHTRAIVLVNPNNPTGAYLRPEEWQQLQTLAAHHGLALIVDEVFAPFPLEAPQDRVFTVLDQGPPPCTVFVLSGLSKLAALPMLKLAWCSVHGPDAKQVMEPLSFMADQYLNVATPVQIALPKILELAPGMVQQIRQRCEQNLKLLDQALEGSPSFHRLPVEGGWSVLLRGPALLEDEPTVLSLLHKGVCVHPGSFFEIPTPGHLVLSLLSQDFSKGLERLFP